jgi:predicted SnoaL-like aldol condensation-catalyzing enzyme
MRQWSMRSIVVAGVALLLSGLDQSANAQQSSVALGAIVREAMISIFDRKDASAVDSFFGDPFVQHDPNVPDGLSGLRQYAADIGASPNARIRIYRTLEDGDLVRLHSKYEGLSGPVSSLVAFDLFASRMAKSLNIGAGRSRKRRPIPRDILRSMGRPKSSIATRPKRTENWCGHSRRRLPSG